MDIQNTCARFLYNTSLYEIERIVEGFGHYLNSNRKEEEFGGNMLFKCLEISKIKGRDILNDDDHLWRLMFDFLIEKSFPKSQDFIRDTETRKRQQGRCKRTWKSTFYTYRIFLEFLEIDAFDKGERSSGNSNNNNSPHACWIHHKLSQIQVKCDRNIYQSKHQGIDDLLWFLMEMYSQYEGDSSILNKMHSVLSDVRGETLCCYMADVFRIDYYWAFRGLRMETQFVSRICSMLNHSFCINSSVLAKERHYTMMANTDASEGHKNLPIEIESIIQSSDSEDEFDPEDLSEDWCDPLVPNRLSSYILPIVTHNEFFGATLEILKEVLLDYTRRSCTTEADLNPIRLASKSVLFSSLQLHKHGIRSLWVLSDSDSDKNLGNWEDYFRSKTYPALKEFLKTKNARSSSSPTDQMLDAGDDIDQEGSLQSALELCISVMGADQTAEIIGSSTFQNRLLLLKLLQTEARNNEDDDADEFDGGVALND